MKRLMGSLIVVALVAVTASAVDAGDRFNPTDRQRPGRKFHLWRQSTPVVVQPAAAAPASDVIRSFSFEPGEAASAACCCKTNCGCNVAAAPAKDADGTVRSFSYEPEAVAAPATRTSTRRFVNRAAERLWRKQHPGVR